ncbi:MAG TPA: sugar phosphate isomerase/epimerase [Planctomycetaceae bacterium]|jgi:sugar phosphate isomerase/epimerase
MSPLRIALATRCLNLPLKDAVRVAASLAVQGVQLDSREELKPGELTETGRRQLLHSLDQQGISVASLAFPTRRSFYDEDQLDARVGAAKRTMELAWQLRARIVTARVGKIPDKESKAYRVLQDVLADLARHGNQVGATLAITPTHDAPLALGELLDSIKTGPLGIDFDTAVFVMSGHNPAQALRTLHASIVHLTARDAIRDIDAGGIETALGRGEVDWVELLPFLDEIDYAGWVTVNRTQGDDRAGDAARAVQYLRNVLLT